MNAQAATRWTGCAGADQTSLAIPRTSALSVRSPVSVGQARDADAPAAERQGLAEPGRHHGALRDELGRTEERSLIVVDQVAVDLVGDDQQVVTVGHLAEGPHRLRGREGAGGVVREGDHDRAQWRTGSPGVGRGGRQRRRVWHTALSGRRGQVKHRGPEQ